MYLVARGWTDGSKTLPVDTKVAAKKIQCGQMSFRWHGGGTGKVFGLAISRLRVQILLKATLRNNLRQVVYTYVPLSPSSITWYRPNGGDALRLGR